MKRLLLLAAVAAALGLAGCSACNDPFHCERPCYAKSFQRDGRKMMDFVDVYLLNYDKHDPYRCDPCLGD